MIEISRRIVLVVAVFFLSFFFFFLFFFFAALERWNLSSWLCYWHRFIVFWLEELERARKRDKVDKVSVSFSLSLSFCVCMCVCGCVLFSVVWYVERLAQQQNRINQWIESIACRPFPLAAVVIVVFFFFFFFFFFGTGSETRDGGGHDGPAHGEQHAELAIREEGRRSRREGRRPAALEDGATCVVRHVLVAVGQIAARYAQLAKSYNKTPRY